MTDALISGTLPSELISRAAAKRKSQGFVGLRDLFFPTSQLRSSDLAQAQARAVAQIFNTPYSTRALIRQRGLEGCEAARNLDAWMEFHGLDSAPCKTVSLERVQALEAVLLNAPDVFIESQTQPYPYSSGVQHWLFDPVWIKALLDKGRQRLGRFTAERRSDVAILVGNGPSLRQTDLSLLKGRDVYISNYAISDPLLSEAARGVAVSNFFVADQAPEAFSGLSGMWRALPVGLSHVLPDEENTLWLNALGGPLFFSTIPQSHIAWHATVTYFWMQVLLAAGYRRVLLIGVDNSYSQPKTVKEGTLIHQTSEDPNHFSPAYFQGKLWQAADTDHMERSYVMAKAAYEAAGAEIVNCTVGGALELFRRAPLEQELRRA